MLITALALLASQALAQQPEAPQGAQPAQQPQSSRPAQPLQQPPQPQPVPSPPTQQAAPPSYSADALYNLANSYARAGKSGLAVLNYQRAALLSPNDPDISANLEYVRAAAHVPADPPTKLARVARAVDPTTAAWLGVLGIALAGTALVAKRVPPRFKWLRATAVLLGIGLISLTLSNAMLLWPRMHEAVVLINQTPARVSPALMGDEAFKLREAETVTVAAEHEDFILIRTRAGRSGWVARASLGAVVP